MTEDLHSGEPLEALRLPLERADTFKTAARDEDTGRQGALDL